MSHIALPKQEELTPGFATGKRGARSGVHLVFSQDRLVVTGGDGASPERQEISVAPNTLSSATTRQIQTKLNTLFEPTESRRWLEAKIPALENRSPLELIELGQAARLLRMLTRIEEGMPA